MSAPLATLPASSPKFPSPLQRVRLGVKTPLPRVLESAPEGIQMKDGPPTSAAGDVEEIQALFPKLFGQRSVSVAAGGDDALRKNLVRTPRVGVVLSGGQAPGGHNVISGLYDYVVTRCKGALFGFLNGPRGIFTGNYVQLDDARVDRFRNQGGFDIIGSGRDKIHSDSQFADSMSHCESLKLDGLVVIGGDDSNTNACMLAEYFASHGAHCKVVGCPKTIDNDLKNEHVPVSFGFDTATKTYSELTGSVALDAISSKKKYHFIRLMGRSASHIALEVALQCRPNLCWLGEEVEAKQMTLAQVSGQLVSLIRRRAAMGKYYGVVLVPEGLIEFVPELGALIAEINDVLATMACDSPPTVEELAPKLKQQGNAELLRYLPKDIAAQLLLERDSHGNVNVSSIETEKLIFQCAMQELRSTREGTVSDPEASVDVSRVMPQFHFFGFEGRSALPSVFDSNYCYALGFNAGLLIAAGKTGVISTISNLKASVRDWTCGGMPLTHMMNMERRAGKNKPVIKKALTELKGKPFRIFDSLRDRWATEDVYRTPGPVQFEGCPGAHAITETLRLEIEQREEESRSEAEISSDGNGDRKRQRIAEGSEALGSSHSHTVFTDSALTSARSSASSVSPLPDVFKGENVPKFVVQTGAQRGHSIMAQMNRFFPHLQAEGEQTTAPLLEFTSSPDSEGGEDPMPPCRVGVVFCGRQAAGGHNIIHGLLRMLKRGNTSSSLLGFREGTRGLINGDAVEITEELLAPHRNHGGYHLLGRSVDCMHLKDELSAIGMVVSKLKLDGLVCIGGTHTACDVAILADYLKGKGGDSSKCAVIAVPATIDGDMMNEYVPATVGFYSNARVCAQLVGNIASDCNSAKKYWYWIRMMGRRPSHVALEVALQTCPNAVLIGEKIRREQKSLAQVVSDLADLICQRHADAGKNFGVILVPEGLLTFIPEMAALLRDLEVVKGDLSLLSPWGRALFEYLPEYIQSELLLAREIHGTPQLSQIETEKMMRELVGRELRKRKAAGAYKGTYKTVSYFAGYQARCGFPSAFDAALGESLGGCAALLVMRGGSSCSGYLASCRNLKCSESSGPAKWKPFGVPLMALLNVKDNRPCYVPTLVDCSEHVLSSDVTSREMASSTPFGMLQKCLKAWSMTESYRNPGPLQFPISAEEQTWDVPLSLQFSSQDGYVSRVEKLQSVLDELTSSCQLGISDAAARVALSQSKALIQTMRALK